MRDRLDRIAGRVVTGFNPDVEIEVWLQPRGRVFISYKPEGNSGVSALYWAKEIVRAAKIVEDVAKNASKLLKANGHRNIKTGPAYMAWDRGTGAIVTTVDTSEPIEVELSREIKKL